MTEAPAPSRAMPVIDADGHVVEPMAAFAHLNHAIAPRVERDAHGYEHVIVGDFEILAAPLGNLATPGSNFSDPSGFATLEEAQPGGADPVARLADMDTEGTDQAVLFPSIGLYFWALEDPGTATALARAYNDWLAGYCAADPARLFGAAMLPFQDPAAAERELRRCHDELGFPAAFVRPNPCMGRVISDRAYDGVWTAAEELGVPIGIHEGSSVIVPTLGHDRPVNPLILHAVSHAFEEMLACAQLIAFGVFERHPALRVLFLESGGGWVPYWLERLDEQVSSFGGFCPDMALMPSEYFARQCAVSYEVDEATLPLLVPLIGEDRVLWGSDYPHHDATFPGAVSALRRTIAPLPPATQARILGANARRLYSIAPRETGTEGVVGDYFLAIVTQDLERLDALFAKDCVLTSGTMALHGVDEVHRFYETGPFLFADLTPRPGPLRVEGNRVSVEIDLRLAGSDSRVLDTFLIEHGRIAHLDIAPLSA